MVSAWPSSMVASAAVLTTMHPRCSAAPLVSDISNSSRLAGVGRLGGDPRGLVRPARRVPAQRREEQGVLVTEGVVQAAPADAFGAKSRGCGRRQVDPAPKNGVSRTG
jgi:hypothetical protein